MVFQKLPTFLLLLFVLALVTQSLQSKKVNCRKYVYAPACRGVQAKRALPKLPNSIREPRQSTYIDFDTPNQWKDKDKEDKGLLHIIYEKLEPKSVDYDNENMENYLN